MSPSPSWQKVSQSKTIEDKSHFDMNYRVQVKHHPFGFIDILWYISLQCSGLISEWFSDITVASWYVSDVSITKVDIEGIVVSKVVMMEHGGVVDLFITFRMILWHNGGFLICLGCLHHQGGHRGHRRQQGCHDGAWERGGVVLVAEATADNTRPAQEYSRQYFFVLITFYARRSVWI